MFAMRERAKAMLKVKGSARAAVGASPRLPRFRR
jgi:hypothetical protein